MGDGRNARNWVVAVDESGRRREFDLAELPLSFGAVGADVGLPGVPGTLQIGKLGETFFLQLGRGTRNVRVNGQAVAGSSELRDGDIIAIDRVRLACRIKGGALTVGVQVQVTAGDTAPPDLEELARTREAAGSVTITPIAFKPAAPTLPEAMRSTAMSPIGIGSSEDPSNPLVHLVRHLASIKWALFVIAGALLAMVALELVERFGR